MPIDPKIFELLRHHDPEERKRGVKALARTEDREALRYLATLYNQELDPEVRDLALKAGQHIKKRGELAKWGEDQGQNTAKFVDVEVKRDAPKQKSKLPTDAKTTEAKALLDKAMNFVMQADYARAQDVAYQAFEIAPHIGNDPYYASVASEVMGMSEKEAIAALKEGQPDYEVGKGKVKQAKNKKPKRAPLGGKAFLLDTVIILGVTIAAEILLRGYLKLEMNPFEIVTGVGSSMIAIWVQFIMIHLAATTRLDGDGSFIDLFRDGRLPVILQSFLYVLAFSYLSHTAPEVLTDPSSVTPEILNTVWTFLIIFAAGYFGYGVWLSIVIGRTYGFNPLKGFAAIFVGNLLTGSFYWMLNNAITIIFVAS